MTSTSMTTTHGTGGRVAGSAERVATSDWAVRLGRAGLVARGVLYLTVALLTFRIAMGEAGATADKQGALITLAQQPFGRWILILTAVGLASYALWCGLKAFLVQEDSDGKAWAKRAGCLGRAVIYGSACAAAISVLQAKPQASTNQKGQGWSATVLGWPGGRFIVGVAGLALIGAALWNGYRAVSRKFEDHLQRSEMSERTWRTVGAIGMGGLLGRMVAFLAVGWFVVKAAVEFNPSEPVGLDQSLRTLQSMTYGPWIIVLAAIGLALFGIYSFAEARWRDLPD
ncbi:MAG: DUF1206 domain-containing protein [Acidimicrobiales bacterium]